jgi:hypothetical protein
VAPSARSLEGVEADPLQASSSDSLDELSDPAVLRHMIRTLRKEAARHRSALKACRQQRQLEAIAGAVSGGDSTPRRQQNI